MVWAARALAPAPLEPAATESQRHATWLELFFNLVFVLALAAVGGRLGGDASPSAREVAAALALFAPVYWAWLGQAFYDTRYDPDDVPHRLVVLEWRVPGRWPSASTTHPAPCCGRSALLALDDHQPGLGSGQHYAYVHGPLGAALLFLGWTLGEILNQIIKGSPQLPLSLRILFVASIATWMLCGLAMEWVALRSVSRRRVVTVLLAFASVSTITAAVAGPATALILVAAVLVGYAISIVRLIIRLSNQPDREQTATS